VDLGRPALRLFAIIVVVALPALAVLALLLSVAADWVARVGPAMAFLLVGVATLAWAAIVASLTSRAATRDLRDVVTLAARGDTGTEAGARAGEDLGAVQRQLRATLDERNRQISTLAADVAGAPITGGPVEVAARVVAVARQVTGDPTWLLVVLQAADPAVLPVGVYTDDPTARPLPVGELEQWAAVSGEPARLQPRYLVGPWGAVVAVDASSGDELTAVLLAPWEGRPEPTRAERDLLSIIAQVAASAMDHSLLYARLRVQTDELNRLALVQRDFLRGITHDLQTPLTSIRALADDIGQGEGLTDQARADLETITHQADRLRRMVGQLLAVSRLEAGALEPRQEVFRVEPIVERTWEALRADRPFAYASTGPTQLAVGDPDRFEQVLWAVLDNAVKYSPARSEIAVTVTATPVDGRGASNGSWSEIAVSDRGPGMSRSVRDRAFDQFFRSDEARKAAPDGSGIGLYAARGLIEAMGGSIRLESNRDEGTTVRIRLPAEPADADGAD
jgi:two-component system sensor histidine kinase KdpD